MKKIKKIILKSYSVLKKKTKKTKISTSLIVKKKSTKIILKKYIYLKNDNFGKKEKQIKKTWGKLKLNYQLAQY